MTQRNHVHRVARKLTLVLLGASSLASTAAMAEPEAPVDPQLSDAALRFSGQIDRPVIEKGEATTEGQSAGYYRFAVSPFGLDVADTFRGEACKKPFEKKAGDPKSGKLFDIISNAKYDMGFSLRLALDPVTKSSPWNNDLRRTEIPVLGLTSTGGKKCEITFGKLRTGRKFDSPWIPVNLGDDQIAKIQFVPWAVKAVDKTRVKAFWTGADALLGFLGPVGTVGRALLDESRSDITVASQARGTVENIFKLSDSGAYAETNAVGLLYEIPLDISGKLPVKSTRGYRFILQDKFGADVTLENRSSILWENEIPTDINTWNDNRYIELLDTKLFASGPKFSEIPPVASVLEQKDALSLDAICKSAFTGLASAGFNESDSAFLIFAAARSAMPIERLQRSKCVNGAKSSRFARMMTKFGLQPLQQPVLATADADWKNIVKLLDNGLKSSNSASRARMANLFKDDIAVYGETNLLPMQPGKTWVTDSKLDGKSQLLANLKNLEPLALACEASDADLKGAMPMFSNAPDASDRTIPMLFFSPDRAIVVLAALEGIQSDKVLISHLWIGKRESLHKQDKTFTDLFAKLAGDSSCAAAKDAVQVQNVAIGG